MGDWIVANVIPSFREIEGTLARLDAPDEHNSICRPKKGNMPGLKRFISAVDGPAAAGIFEDLPPLQGSAAEYIGYPIQKPHAPARRIIEAGANPAIWFLTVSRAALARLWRRGYLGGAG